jgi:hypothetical protein
VVPASPVRQRGRHASHRRVNEIDLPRPHGKKTAFVERSACATTPRPIPDARSDLLGVRWSIGYGRITGPRSIRSLTLDLPAVSGARKRRWSDLGSRGRAARGLPEPRDPLEDVFESGGELFVAVGCTPGGAPFGPRVEIVDGELVFPDEPPLDVDSTVVPEDEDSSH